jgi:hypothetical protein
MTARRFSIKQALAATRGARSSVAKARVRYGNRFELDARLRLALHFVNQAEKQLRFAMRDALARRERKRAQRKAA